MKKLVCLLLMLLMVPYPLAAKKIDDLMKMPTEALFDMELEDLLDVEIKSAGKMAEKVSEIPASVYIVSREDIETHGYQTVADIFRHIPGFYTIYDYEEDVIGLRGVLNDKNIIIMVNGVVQHGSDLHTFMLTPEAIDRIEIVRGPMSVIYGSGAFLGSINIVTNQIPYGDALNTAMASYGSADTSKAFARASGENGKLKYTLNASVYHSDGVEESYRSMVGDELFYELKERYPTAHDRTHGDLERDSHAFNLSALYRAFSFDFQFNMAESGVFAGPSFSSEGSIEKVESIASQLGYKRELAQTLVAEAKITYSCINIDESEDTYPPEIYGPNQTFYVDGSEDRAEIELDLVWKPYPTFNTVAGVNYKTYFDTQYNALQIPQPLSSPYDYVNASYEASDRDTRSIFMQANYKPKENLKLVVGARLEQYRRFETLGVIHFPDETKWGVRNTFNDDEKVWFIPRLAAVWNPRKQHILKLMYGEANRPFEVEEFAYFELESGVFNQLEPEEIETVELNYLFSAEHFSFSFSLFKNNIENLRTINLVDLGGDELTPVMGDTGRMENHGGEAILMTQPFENLGLDFNLSYQETHNCEDNAWAISHSPHLLMKAKTHYQWEPFIAALSVIYVDEMEPHIPVSENAPQDLESTDSYFITQFNLRYDHKNSGLYAALNIDNLFDQEVRYAATENAQFKYGLLDHGRRIMATIGWRF